MGLLGASGWWLVRVVLVLVGVLISGFHLSGKNQAGIVPQTRIPSGNGDANGGASPTPPNTPNPPGPSR